MLLVPLVAESCVMSPEPLPVAASTRIRRFSIPLVFGLLPVSCGEGEPFVLQLTEVNALALPSSVSISGVHVRHGATVVWSVSPPQVLLLGPVDNTAIGAERLVKPIAAAVLDDGGSIEVVDALRSSVLTYSISGQLRSEVPFSVRFIPLTASRYDLGWLVAGAVRGDTVHIALIPHDGRATRVIYSLPPGPQGKQRLGQLEASGLTAVYAEMSTPFAVHLLDSTGEMRSIDLPPPSSRPASRRQASDSAVWVALRAVSVDSLLVQTLADLRSTSRILRVFDLAGESLQSIEFDAPVGIASVDPISRRLVAVRRAKQQELVFYPRCCLPGNFTWSRSRTRESVRLRLLLL